MTARTAARDVKTYKRRDWKAIMTVAVVVDDEQKEYKQRSAVVSVSPQSQRHIKMEGQSHGAYSIPSLTLHHV